VSFAGAVRGALRRIEPDEPVTQIRTMEEVATDSMGPRRFPMLLLSLFSAVALLLAVVGVYGVVSYVVSQRRREIGIRVALGAKRAEVIGMVVRQSLVPIAAGIAAGLGLAVLVSRSLDAMLFGVTPQDATVLVATVGILAASGVAACLVPARRAARVDPLVVLREE
jgi:ABC-type antimicrobial peptide transport system permease subunit